jgi:hypothetical protein
MKVFFRFEPTPEQMAKLFGADAQGARRAGFINVVTMIEAAAVKKAPVKTSNLADSHTSDVNANATRGFVRFTAPYAKYVHEGTGLYGPHKTMIVPKELRNGRDAQGRFVSKGTTGKKALYWPGALHPVRAVKGMEGRPFLREAAEEADLQRLFSDGVNNYMAGRGNKT